MTESSLSSACLQILTDFDASPYLSISSPRDRLAESLSLYSHLGLSKAISRYQPIFITAKSTDSLQEIVSDYSVFLQFYAQAKAAKQSMSEDGIQALGRDALSVSDRLQLKLRSGNKRLAVEVCADKLCKRKAGLYACIQTTRTCALQFTVLQFEQTLLELGQRQWLNNEFGPAIATLNRVLRIRHKDFSRRATFPIETESQWAIKASVLTSYQLGLGENEEALEAEVFFRCNHSLEVAAIRVSAGLAAGYKSLGDRYWADYRDEGSAVECYRRATATVSLVAKDFLTLAQVKRELLGKDFVTYDTPLDIVRSLSEYYTAIQAKSLALKCLGIETRRDGVSSIRMASLSLSLGEMGSAWKWLLLASKETSGKSTLVHKYLGDVCEATGDLPRALLEYKAALSHAQLNSSGDREKEEIELKTWGIEAALANNEAIPSYFNAQVAEFLESRTIRRPEHTASRNLYPCDDMGGEIGGMQQTDCYCHDPHVLIAEAEVAQGRPDNALRNLVAAAESFAPRATLNSALGWKRAGDCALFHTHDSAQAMQYYWNASESLLVCNEPEGCWMYEEGLERKLGRGSVEQVRVWVGLSMMLERYGRKFESGLWRQKAISVMKEVNMDLAVIPVRGRQWALYTGNVYIRNAKSCFHREEYQAGINWLLRLRLHTEESDSLTYSSRLTNLLWRSFCEIHQYDHAEVAAVRNRVRTAFNFSFHELRKVYNGMRQARHVMDDSSSEEELFKKARDRLNSD